MYRVFTIICTRCLEKLDPFEIQPFSVIGGSVSLRNKDDLEIIEQGRKAKFFVAK